MGLSQVALSLLSTLEERGTSRTESWAEEGLAFRKVTTTIKGWDLSGTIRGLFLALPFL
jgi:hypothetical protein